MSNPSRKKGTEGENYWRGYLQGVFGPQVDRLDNRDRGNRASDGDFVGVPWLHEAKNTDRAGLTKWIRTARAKAGTRWALLWKGDMRTLDGQPIVVVDPVLYAELVEAWLEKHGL